MAVLEALVSLTPIVLMVFAGSAPTQDAVRAAIAAANKRFADAMASGDAAGVAALYSPSAQVFPPGEAMQQGSDAIRSFWQGAIDSGMRDVALRSVEIESHGDTAHEIGTVSVRDAEGAEIATGKYAVIWKLVGNQWMLHRDIWNLDGPQ